MTYLFIIIISLILSFFFSGTETAFVSVNKVRVEVWRRQKIRFYKIILRFIEHPERFLYTTLIGNNIANIAFASYATIYFNRYLEPHYTWLLIVAASVLLGEIIPKTLFRFLADWVVRKVSVLLEFFHYLFLPFSLLTNFISHLLLKLMGHKEEELDTFFSQKDIELLLHKSQTMVRLNHEMEGEYFTGLLRLRNLKVREVMVPRTEMIAVPDTISIEELIEVMSRKGVTRVPVYKEELDNIVGVVFLKDLFQEPQSLEEIIKKPYLVPETKPCIRLLSEFRDTQNTIAIVFDEYGGIVGLVTLEDLVEELFGEIEDEFDTRTKMVVQDKDNPREYWVNARIEIEKFNEEIPVELPEGEYETLAGFLLTQFGKIPRRGDKLEYQGVIFEINSADRQRIKSVKVILPESMEETQ